MFTLDSIADYCEFKDSVVKLGSPEVGFVEIDGHGVRKTNNYNRLRSMNEMAASPSLKEVLKSATIFRIRRGSEVRVLQASEFQAELERFRSLLQDS